MKKDNKQKIVIEQFAEFELVIIKNISELLVEAKQLFKSKHYARAFALAYLSFEENAKITLFTFLIMDNFIGQPRSFSALQEIFNGQLFKNHKKKLRLAFLPLPDFDFQKSITTINFLNELKNRSLYSDIFELEMCKPSDFFGKDQALDMINIAENTLNSRLREFDVDKTSNVTKSIILSRYNELQQVFETQLKIIKLYNETDTLGKYKNYLNFLDEVIKSEILFNQMKQSYNTK